MENADFAIVCLFLPSIWTRLVLFHPFSHLQFFACSHRDKQPKTKENLFFGCPKNQRNTYVLIAYVLIWKYWRFIHCIWVGWLVSPDWILAGVNSIGIGWVKLHISVLESKAQFLWTVSVVPKIKMGRKTLTWRSWRSERLPPPVIDVSSFSWKRWWWHRLWGLYNWPPFPFNS